MGTQNPRNVGGFSEIMKQAEEQVDKYYKDK